MISDCLIYKRGDVIGSIGLMGAGKTLNAVRLARLLAVRYGLGIVANLDLVGIQYQRLRKFSEFPTISNSIIILDEAGLLLDSRKFASAANIFITNYLLLIRKRGNILLYTVQQPRLTDVRLFENSSYLYYLENYHRDYSRMSLVRIGLTSAKFVFMEVAFDRRPWYGLYDTNDTDVFLEMDIDTDRSKTRSR